jgi:hypothetical protein
MIGATSIFNSSLIVSASFFISDTSIPLQIFSCKDVAIKVETSFGRNPPPRVEHIPRARQRRGYLSAEETELLALTDSALGKLQNMSDAEYDALDLLPDFDVEVET